MSRLVIGVGNDWRADDAAGLEVARRLRHDAPPGLAVAGLEGDCSSLLSAWRGYEDVVVVDAVSSGAEPGTVHRLDADADVLPPPRLRSSTHGFGVADAVQLGRSLGRLPQRLRVIGIEGRDFRARRGLSPEVDAAAIRVAEELSATLPGVG